MPQFGFRTSFLGFKKEEVNAYIGHISKEAREKEQNLENQLSELKNQVQKLTQELEEKGKALDEMNAKVDYYSGKEAEIEKMSISIGTMYMVAKQNAAEIIAGAENCAKEIAEHSKNQLAAADEADGKLKALKSELNLAAEKFADNVSAMTQGFEDIKIRLENQLAKIGNGNNEVALICEIL